MAPRHQRASVSIARPIGTLLVGAVVALALGGYARLHQPTGLAVTTFGFSGTLQMKAWLTTAALALAAFQGVSALWMYGRLGSLAAPSWLGTAHRVSGSVAFLLTVPVAFHCLWSLGFATYDARTTAHSLLGCLFYGAFAAKMLALRDRHGPRWLLPVLGGSLLTILTGLWVTASLWFFTQVRTPLF